MDIGSFFHLVVRSNVDTIYDAFYLMFLSISAMFIDCMRPMGIDVM